jgi:hypothetical protein
VSLCLLRGFVTVDFSGMRSIAPRPTPNLEDQGQQFVWLLHLICLAWAPAYPSGPLGARKLRRQARNQETASKPSSHKATARPSTSEFLAVFAHVPRKHMDYAFWNNDRWALTCCARV